MLRSSKSAKPPLILSLYFLYKRYNNLLKLPPILLLLLGLISSEIPAYFAPQNALAVTPHGYLRLDRMAISTTGIGGTVCQNTGTTTNVDRVLVTFPSSTYYTLNTTGTNYTIDTTSIPAGTTAWPGMGSPTVTAAGQLLTITGTSSSLTSGTTYCLHWSGASTVTSTANAATNSLTGTIETRLVGASVAIVNYAIATVTNDQVTVTGSLSSIFSMGLSTNTQSLTLDPTTVNSSTGVVVTISTNAANGWTSWVTDSQNGSLHSNTTTQNVVAVNTYANCPGSCSLNSNTGFGLSTLVTTGTPTVDSHYDGSGGTNKVGTLQNVLEALASNTVPANGDQITMTFKAKPVATVPAGTDYIDVVTVVGAGNF